METVFYTRQSGLSKREACLSASDHLTPQEIQAFIEGRLDRSERERILEHLDHCRLCVKLLADVVREKRAPGSIPC